MMKITTIFFPKRQEYATPVSYTHLASAATQEESSSTDNSIEDNVSEDSSFENDTSESIESETQNASLDEPNESAAPVIESDHKFMTGLFAACLLYTSGKTDSKTFHCLSNL